MDKNTSDSVFDCAKQEYIQYLEGKVESGTATDQNMRDLKYLKYTDVRVLS